MRAAGRRKALASECLPFGVGALDGKATALPTLNHPLVQNHVEVEGQVVPFGEVRTVTARSSRHLGGRASMPSRSPARPNEMGHFQAAFKSLVATHGSLIDLVSYNAGALSARQC